MKESVVSFMAEQRDRYSEELAGHPAIPRVGALPHHAGDVRRGSGGAACRRPLRSRIRRTRGLGALDNSSQLVY